MKVFGISNVAAKMQEDMNKEILKQLEAQRDHIRSRMTVEEWLLYGEVHESLCLQYPNARTAYEINTSPLWQELN